MLAKTGGGVKWCGLAGSGGGASKDCFAKGQLLAVGLEEALYYNLNDPAGAEAGRVLYDGYGGILSSTLSVTLTNALAGQGDAPDPSAGLVYLGGGRYYDPSLGRPLQPIPIGGPPTVPQALNRYSATPLGQPGVTQAVMSNPPWIVEYAIDKARQEVINETIVKVGHKLGIAHAFSWVLRPTGLQYVKIQGQRRAFKGAFSSLTTIAETKASAGLMYLEDTYGYDFTQIILLPAAGDEPGWAQRMRTLEDVKMWAAEVAKQHDFPPKP